MNRNPEYFIRALSAFAFILGIAIPAHAQVITLFAGSACNSFSGDGGAATAACLSEPMGVAVDSAGNVYSCDGNNFRIRKVNTAGIISTYAGGMFGFGGDGGPATNARLYSTFDVQLDRKGNMYIMDRGNFRVRKVDTAGIITTVAGNGICCHGGDGGPATNASINYVNYIGVDDYGNVYLPDTGSIRKVDAATGIIHTIAGNGTSVYSGDGGPATAAGIGPTSIACDRKGNIYVGEARNHRVRKIDTAGIIHTIAGNGTSGFSGDGGPATNAQFVGLESITVDIAGNLYIVDEQNDRVRKVDALGKITTVIGNGVVGWSGDGGPATAAELNYMCRVAKYGSGNIYVTDRNNYHVRMVTDTNHAVYFTGGHSLTFAFCSLPSLSIDALLSATDMDTAQVEMWSLIYGPFHGAVNGNYSGYSTGGTVTPVGLTYAPNPGYVGYDTFKVRVSDGYTADTTIVYVRVDTTLPVAGIITGHDSVCIGDTIMLADTITSGVWRSFNTRATVSTGTVTGMATGTDTIYYIVTNTCGADTASHVVNVKHCSSSVPITALQGALTISPNPNKGAFTFMLSAPYREDVHITITNLEGETVKEITTTTNNATEIMLHAPAGTYLLHATTAHGVWNNEVVVTQ